MRYSILGSRYKAKKLAAAVFETIDTALREKGSQLHYGRALRCVASQCIAYEPFPPARLMVPIAERKSREIGEEIAVGANGLMRDGEEVPSPHDSEN